MRRLQRWTLALAASLAMTGCAATMNVSSHVERGLDFSSYRSFDWGPADALPKGDSRLDNPFFADYFQGAVEKRLAARGIELASGTPDLLIHYHANIRQRIDANRVDSAYEYCGTSDCPQVPIEYAAGTLVLDVIDARTNRLVWRGWAQNSVEAMLHDRDRMAATIDRAVTRMLERLPRY